MSSMLKKTGGLVFKPRANRRAAAASSSQAPTGSASTSRAPTVEPQSQSQASTPAPASTSAAIVTSTSRASVDPSTQVATDASKETPIEATKGTIPNPTAAALPPTPEPTQLTSSQTETQNYAPSQPRSEATGLGTNPPSVSKKQAKVPPTTNSNALVTPTATGSTPAPTQITTRAETEDTQPSVTNTDSALAPEVRVIAAEKDAGDALSTTADAQQLLSPAAAALRRALPSPSPFPVSETIHAVPPPDDTTEAGPSTAAPKKKRAPRKRKLETQEGENGEETTVAKPKRPRKTKATSSEAPDGEISDGEVGRSAPKRVYRRRRAPTPEDAEEIVIDRSTMKLGELTKDLRIGKKFKHADAIAERQRQARHDAKMRKLERQKIAMGLISAEPDNAGGSRSGTPADGAGAKAVPGLSQAHAAGNVGYEIIDGQIVINQQSLIVDQHANQDSANLETVEEDEFTHLTTSSTYMRKSRAMGTNHWTDAETERFYYYLKMFGTDFETISHMFPGKNRRMVKLKFNREERIRPKRVNASIMARGAKKIAIDIEEYKNSRRGESFQTKDKILEEQARLREVHEADLEARRQQRRDMGMLDEEPTEVVVAKEDAAKEKGRPGRKKKDAAGESAEQTGEASGEADAETTIEATVEATVEAS